MGKVQLFFLPYAGGSSFSFMKVVRLLKPDIEAITIEYAGRGKRNTIPFLHTYEEFLIDVIEEIGKNRYKGIPYAFFGYSMGSAIAFDICSTKLLEENPIHCFFCAEGGLISQNESRNYSLLKKAEFKDKIIALGGIDNRIMKNQDVLDDYLRLIMMDYNILGQFKYNGKKIMCPSSVLYSEDDETCVHMDEWIKVVENNVDFYKFTGSHFFINKDYVRIAEIINSKI